jgi:hypothetical protein
MSLRPPHSPLSGRYRLSPMLVSMSQRPPRSLSPFRDSIETLGQRIPGDTDAQELPLSVRHEPEEGEDLLILQLGPYPRSPLSVPRVNQDPRL